VPSRIEVRVRAALTHFGLTITPRKDYLRNQHDSKIWLTFSVRHLNTIKSTAGRSFLGFKPLPALQQM
jgi:hypothetical protein